ncbi:hypothetical protein PsorP6_003131 [Peronosclerospora sorghi]|uniref:Uncharacterized protein n=1 Tax=Peronosclerospora sorghi TaxID=230839 RepID=A0ACC0VP84_9STRA|nr:hypothetical protein PsorP6_003131 [Peronosclerospora sorghi]
MDQDEEMQVYEYFVPAWTLDEYFTAVEDDELFRVVIPQLDASDDRETAADVNEFVKTIDHHDVASAANYTTMFRQSLVLSKHYVACGSARGGVTLYDGDEIINWPSGRFLVVDPRNLCNLPSKGWLKPHKYNHGGYDAIYVDKAAGLIHLVQVTKAHHHTFHIGYFHQFLCNLRDLVRSFDVKTLEIFFVIEREALSDFQFSNVTGEGPFSHFCGLGEV